MKKIFLFLSLFSIIFSTYSCRKLDIGVDSQYVQDNFPETSSDYAALLGTMYSNLSSSYAIAYWRLQELSTDEAILPARDGNYDDGGQYRQLHYHTWTPDHPIVQTIWQWGFGGINTCNRLISLVNGSSVTDDSTKTSTLASIRAMRALYYFFMMDTYGNVPIITSFPVADPPATNTRSEVFKFIESELLDIEQQMPSKTSDLATNTLQYGIPTKGMVFALLEKMYLNSVVYTGTVRYKDVVAMADSVMANANYTLDVKYRDIFLPDNGPQISETIFAVPYDQQIPGNQFTRFGFYPALLSAYTGFSAGLSIAMSTTPEFYHRFNLPGDSRSKTWLAGPQFYPDGNGGFTDQPAYYPNTTKQININPILILVPGKPMDLGNTTASQEEGVRSIKYYPDPQTIQATRLNGNDVPVFRLADVMLMKAEAILRGAPATTVNGVLQTPDYLINQLRTRAGATVMSEHATLDTLLDERARELSWEGWRRNDLIRFGLFEKKYPLPNDNLTIDTDPSRRLYPVPATELALNPNLVQNQGYDK